ncbi:hypothetical protein AOZ06_45580 [Kibdelosporangium phytohabitans]|uniref:Uncharacterized protein n=1 Tax=Kibdelosporangium phytohabitans TaxID=860235 RepID=A0A0N9IDM9_9PSEU|nr:hypothetical protein AOZ06_45580 [Kibdelosporangium phytohabitans]
MTRLIVEQGWRTFPAAERFMVSTARKWAKRYRERTWRCSVLRECRLVVISVLRASRSLMRRSRHCCDSTDNSISAVLSQDPCSGV